MNIKSFNIFFLVATAVFLSILLLASPAQAKKPTIYDSSTKGSRSTVLVKAVVSPNATGIRIVLCKKGTKTEWSAGAGYFLPIPFCKKGGTKVFKPKRLAPCKPDACLWGSTIKSKKKKMSGYVVASNKDGSVRDWWGFYR